MKEVSCMWEFISSSLFQFLLAEVLVLPAEVPQKSLNCFNFLIFFLTSIWQFCEQSEINPQHRTTEKLSPERRAKDEEGICWEITQWAWKYKRAVEIYERR